MKAKYELTEGQRSRIKEKLIWWGDDLTKGLTDLFEREVANGNQNPAFTVDQELAYRIAWIRQAKSTPASELIVVSHTETTRIMAQM
jgi:hypothetical protein